VPKPCGLSILADLAVNGDLKWILGSQSQGAVSSVRGHLDRQLRCGKEVGIYQRRGTEAPSGWQRYLKLYVLSTVLLFLLPLSMIAIERA
jgi:hypothetical protein